MTNVVNVIVLSQRSEKCLIRGYGGIGRRAGFGQRYYSEKYNCSRSEFVEEIVYMFLRKYKKEDSTIICKWLRTEEELYRWSADRFNKFPLLEDDIDNRYTSQIETGRFIPLTAIDEKENLLGHFIIRYPREGDDSTVRFGFVILNPALRGKGFGKEMLHLGIEYVKDNLSAKRIDLGVFSNNDNARFCYEAIGFREYSRRKCEMPIGVWECIDMELFIT